MPLLWRLAGILGARPGRFATYHLRIVDLSMLAYTQAPLAASSDVQCYEQSAISSFPHVLTNGTDHFRTRSARLPELRPSVPFA